MERRTTPSEFTSETTSSTINFETPSGFIITIMTQFVVIICLLPVLISLVFRVYRTLGQFRKLLNLYAIACILYPISSTIFFIVNNEWSFIDEAKMITILTFILDLMFFTIFLYMSKVPKREKYGLIGVLIFMAVCFLSTILLRSFRWTIDFIYILFFVLIFAKINILLKIKTNAQNYSRSIFESNNTVNVIQDDTIQNRDPDLLPAYATAYNNTTLYPPSNLFQNNSSDQLPPAYNSITKPSTEV